MTMAVSTCIRRRADSLSLGQMQRLSRRWVPWWCPGWRYLTSISPLHPQLLLRATDTVDLSALWVANLVDVLCTTHARQFIFDLIGTGSTDPYCCRSLSQWFTRGIGAFTHVTNDTVPTRSNRAVALPSLLNENCFIKSLQINSGKLTHKFTLCCLTWPILYSDFRVRYLCYY